jgi:hypothetical protein
MIFIHCSMTHCVMQEERQGCRKQPRVAFPYRFGKTETTYIPMIDEKSQPGKGGAL